MLSDSELARKTNGRIEIRPTGLRISWEISDLTTSDGHSAVANFSCTATALPSPTEIKMLEEALLSSRPAISDVDVRAYFAGAMQSAARKQAGRLDAQSLLADAGRQNLIAVLMDAGKAVAFGCGIELLPPVQLDLDCPTLRRQQSQQRRSAEQTDQLRRSRELFAQFESIRASAPELSPGQVLGRIGVADQADLLRSLLLASAGKTAGARLWAVAGPSLIAIPNEDSPVPKLIPLPAELGPLRSISPGVDGELLVGCRGGVMRVDPESPEKAMLFQDPRMASQLGFNAAILVENCIWATHGEAGLVAWQLNDPAAPQIAVRPKSVNFPDFSPRNLAAVDANRLIVSTARQLFTASSDGQIAALGAPASADIVGIFAQEDQILIVQEDGLICALNPRDLSEICRQRRTGRVTAAATLPWLDDARLLLATEDGPILCAGIDDDLITQYASAHRAPRIVAGASDRIAAVTSDRQRLILWRSWDGRKPYAELHLANLAKHRIADVGFA